MKPVGIALALLLAGGAGVGGYAVYEHRQATTLPEAPPAAAMATVPVTIASAGGRHVFTVEVAGSPAQQEHGLMYRTGIRPDAGMLFWPYPAGGGAPQVANFWMKNTPTPLDIVFIRADGVIARIAENTVPFSEAPVSSGEPVAAVLELVGGRAADLGIAEGDKVTWPGR